MSAISNVLLLSDGAVTANKLVTSSATVGTSATFAPAGFVAPGVPRWENRSGGIPVGYPYFTMALRRPSRGNRNYKVTVRVFMPTLEQVAPSVIWTKAYDCAGFLEFILPERSTTTERLALLNTVRSLMMTTVEASDAVPSDTTGSPVGSAVSLLEDVY